MLPAFQCRSLWKCCLLGGCAAVLSSDLMAQEPSISGTVPGALAPGATANLQIQGGGLVNTSQLWTSFPATATLAPGIEGNGTNAANVTFQLAIPANVSPGIYGLRAVTDHGVSPLKLFVIDDLPSVAAAGNLTAKSTAQSVTLPIAVDGGIAGQTAQYFRFNVLAGQTVSFEVLARRIGSALDPVIRILDLYNRELASNDDAPGQSGDSQLSHTFTVAGEYLLELRDIRYQGGAYRLRIGDFPCAAVAYPLAIQRGTQAPIAVAGKFVEGIVPTTVTAPTEPGINWIYAAVKRVGGASSGFAPVAVVDNRQFLEQEPNNAPSEANRIELGMDVNGRFEQPGDVDRFIFTAKKDQSFLLTGFTRQQGSPADLSFKVLGPDGAQIAAAEDAGTAEGSFTVKFPADGDFTLVVEELNRRGGPDEAYRIAVTPAAPPFTLAASTDTLNVPVGGVASVLVTATRAGYGGPIEISLVDPPAGLTPSKTIIGESRPAAVLTIQARPDFAGGALHGLKINGTARIGEADVVATADINGVLKTRFSNMRFPPAALANSIVASAAPAAGMVLKAEPSEIVFGKNLSAKVKLTVERSQGLDEAVAIAVFPAQDGLPAGVTAAVKNIDKGANEVEIVYSANDKIPLGDFTAALQGTLKQGDKTIVQPVPAIRLKLQNAMTVSLNAGSAKLARGGELSLKVHVQRNPALSGPVTLTVQNLPAGVTAAAATLPAEANDMDIKLTAAADAAVGAKADVNVKGEAMAGNAKLDGVSANVTITVE